MPEPFVPLLGELARLLSATRGSRARRLGDVVDATRAVLELREHVAAQRWEEQDDRVRLIVDSALDQLVEIVQPRRGLLARRPQQQLPPGDTTGADNPS